MIICHQVNTLAELEKIPKKYGVEVDVRHSNLKDALYLNHNPGDGDLLRDYLKVFNHRFIIFNIKEAGIEQGCIDLAQRNGIPRANYFLLDVEFPYIYRAAGFPLRDRIRSGEIKKDDYIHELAVRFSEAEPIEQTLALEGIVDWAWIDTNTRLPLDEDSVGLLSKYKTCLVCPERWGRPEDIPKYAAKMKELKFKPCAVMTNIKYAEQWEQTEVVKP